MNNNLDISQFKTDLIELNDLFSESPEDFNVKISRKYGKRDVKPVNANKSENLSIKLKR